MMTHAELIRRRDAAGDRAARKQQEAASAKKRHQDLAEAVDAAVRLGDVEAAVRAVVEVLKIAGEGQALTMACEEAIRRFSHRPEVFHREYVGVTEYANFGPQEACCQYGYGPKHGSIVARVSPRDATPAHLLDPEWVDAALVVLHALVDGRLDIADYQALRAVA